jgi:hypothetical protein
MKIFCCSNLSAAGKNCMSKSPLLPSDGSFYLWQQVNNCITSTILTSLTYYKNKRAIGISAIARESLVLFAAHKVLPFMNILQSASGAACLLPRDAVNQWQMKR